MTDAEFVKLCDGINLDDPYWSLAQVAYQCRIQRYDRYSERLGERFRRAPHTIRAWAATYSLSAEIYRMAQVQRTAIPFWGWVELARYWRKRGVDREALIEVAQQAAEDGRTIDVLKHDLAELFGDQAVPDYPRQFRREGDAYLSLSASLGKPAGPHLEQAGRELKAAARKLSGEAHPDP